MIVSLFVISTWVSAVSRERVGADTLVSRLMYQVWSYPQEKVYVSTDRDAYVSGDTVRFRAFLTDAATHARPAEPSRFVYVELQDPFGNRAMRVKTRETDGMFAGILPLDQELPEGVYTLCAYTQFMQNSGKDYFFRKTLPVFSQLSGKYRIEATAGKGILSVRLVEKGTGRPVTVSNISVTDREGDYLTHKVRNRSSYTLDVTERLTRSGHVKVKFDKYEKYVPVPRDTSAISVTFHPEGGHLIPGEKCRLAFKALGPEGLGADFRANIVDSDGNPVSEIATSHCGIGLVEFTPEAGKGYAAVSGEMTIPIPEAVPEACVLKVDRIGTDSVLVRAAGNYRPGLSLLAHNGGNVSFAAALDSTGVRIGRSSLGSGIVQFVLVDERCGILSTRMIFNRTGYIYSDSLDSLPEGDYCVKAFRDGGMKTDSCTSIVSGLLLQSELRGHIEDPEYYFRNCDSLADARLDMLLLTQGWERYDIGDAIKGNYAEPEIPVEIGGEISGTVRSRWRSRLLPDAVVMLISPQLDYASQTVTDADGRFVFNGIDWPDETSFVIQVFGKSGSREHNYAVDAEEVPESNPLEIKNSNVISENIIDERLLTAGTILLDELVVTAPLSAEESRREMLAALGVRSFTSEEMESQHITTYEEVLRKIPGLRIVNGNVVSSFAKGAYNTGLAGSNVEFWVDGTRWTPFSSSSGSLGRSNAPILMNAPMAPEHTYRENMSNTLADFSAIYPFHIVESIEYYRPSAAMIISKEATMGGGALVITTKDGSKIREWDDDLFVRSFKPMGYQDFPEAYSPHYVYDLTADDETFNAAWLPRVTGRDSLPEQEGVYVEIEGFTEGYIPVLIRARKVSKDN